MGGRGPSLNSRMHSCEILQVCAHMRAPHQPAWQQLHFTRSLPCVLTPSFCPMVSKILASSVMLLEVSPSSASSNSTPTTARQPEAGHPGTSLCDTELTMCISKG